MYNWARFKPFSSRFPPFQGCGRWSLPEKKGDIAQLARAPALQAGGQGFKPPYLQ